MQIDDITMILCAARMEP